MTTYSEYSEYSELDSRTATAASATPTGGAGSATPRRARPPRSSAGPLLDLAGVTVDLLQHDEAVHAITARASQSHVRPLAVISADLEHVHHFGRGSRWKQVLDQTRATGDVDVLTLLGGTALARQAARLTGRHWPRLAGRDLIGPLLDAAEAEGLSVGLLGGPPETHDHLLGLLAAHRPNLEIGGSWTPTADELGDQVASRAVAEEVARAGVDILAVCLGKPHQELWITEHGAATGAGVLLASTGVLEALAGEGRRTPPASRARELLREPGRLAVHRPSAYRALRLHSSRVDGLPPTPTPPGPPDGMGPQPYGAGETVHHPSYDVTAIVVTHNNERDVPALLDSVRLAATDLRVRMVVVDNDSSDATVDLLVDQPDVTVINAPGNVGYAAAINIAMARIDQLGAAASTRSVLILNPDLWLEPGALQAMWSRLWRDGVGVVAPRLSERSGQLDHSLHFEPTFARTLADAVLGARVPGRRPWASEMDWDEESYRHPHPIDWATGACLLLRRTVMHHVGSWDESYFLYSEEVDYLRRVRESGWSVWFEPAAGVTHLGRGSGSSPELDSLMRVNRVRYVEAAHGRRQADLVRVAALLGEVLRSTRGPGHRRAAHYLARRRRWQHLPSATFHLGVVSTSRKRPILTGTTGTAPALSVVIPAHDEEATIGRCLDALASSPMAGNLEVVVVANGCSDETADVARRHGAGLPRLRVVELAEPGKPGALNRGDEVATSWPRVYLDADIELSPDALESLAGALSVEDAVVAVPKIVLDSSAASRTVRMFYSVFSALPYVNDGLVGLGAFAMSRAGRARFHRFPDVRGDDLFVQQMFSRQERLVTQGTFTVRTPRTLKALLDVRTRVAMGNGELHLAGARDTTRTTLVALGALAARGPGAWPAIAVYVGTQLAARLRASHATESWLRDDSSREPSPEVASPLARDGRSGLDRPLRRSARDRRAADASTAEVLMVASAGGHLTELYQLRETVSEEGRRHWVTFDTPQSRSLLASESVTFLPTIGPRHYRALFRNLPRAALILARLRPGRVVSTGSGVALAFLPLARLLGREAIYIESATRVAGPSLTGRLLALLPWVRLYTQHAANADRRWQFRWSVFDQSRVRDPLVELGTRKPPVVLVMLGTLDFPFDRLVTALLAAAPRDTTWIWQLGSTPAPRGLPGHAFTTVESSELDGFARQATMVVTHAGVGSALTALNNGVSPILVPRLKAFGEHVDDHQAELADVLHQAGLVRSVTVDEIGPEMFRYTYRMDATRH